MQDPALHWQPVTRDGRLPVPNRRILRVLRCGERLRLLLLAICLCALGAASVAAEEVQPDCTLNGIALKGKVKVVTSFPDIKVQQVTSFPDLRVKRTTSVAHDCGEWHFVESFPDFTIQFVTSFPDLKITFVQSFPGLP